jgi:hypothetical protein
LFDEHYRNRLENLAAGALPSLTDRVMARRCAVSLLVSGRQQ